MINIREKLKAHLHQSKIFDHPAFPGQTNHRQAAILVPLLFEETITCVLTKRASTLTHHAGEISFPGGLTEPQDRNLQDTALREAHEELGIEKPFLLGKLPSTPLLTSNFRLFPYVADIQSQPLQPNPSEVAKVLLFPIESLLQKSVISAIQWEKDGQTYISPVFEFQGEWIFGGTARVLFSLLEKFALVSDLPQPVLHPSESTFQKLRKWRASIHNSDKMQ